MRNGLERLTGVALIRYREWRFARLTKYFSKRVVSAAAPAGITYNSSQPATLRKH
jgi:hypothetical protein